MTSSFSSSASAVNIDFCLTGLLYTSPVSAPVACSAPSCWPLMPVAACWCWAEGGSGELAAECWDEGRGERGSGALRGEAVTGAEALVRKRCSSAVSINVRDADKLRLVSMHLYAHEEAHCMLPCKTCSACSSSCQVLCRVPC